jgi:hypothetical protein
MFLYSIKALPFDIPAILKFGIIGFGSILAILTFWLLSAEQKKANPRRSILMAIYVFMVFSIIMVVFGLLAHDGFQDLIKGYLVPEQKKETVKRLPDETSGMYMLMKDISIFDLRGWKPVPADKINEKYSPANYINYLHIKKTKKLDTIVIHYATSGYDIDIRCITHNYKNYVEDTATSDHKGQKSFGIAIDVSDVPLDEEFLVVVEATYWNGFRNLTSENALTYTNQEITGLNELDLIVLMPYDKPVIQVDKSKGKNGDFYPYISQEKFYVDKQKRFVYWSIKDIDPDTHYKLDWTW